MAAAPAQPKEIIRKIRKEYPAAGQDRIGRTQVVTRTKHSYSRAFILLAAALVCACAVLSACSEESTDFLSWTGKDWDKASSEEKTAAAQAVMTNLESSVNESLGDDADALSSEQLTESAKAMVENIDQYFEAMPDSTLQDLLDQTKALLGL